MLRVMLCCVARVVVVVGVCVLWVVVEEEGRGEGERQIEPSGSWLPPKFPSRLVKLNSFIR